MEATKEMTAKEKEQVNLEERRKHAKTKAKKLQKTLANVGTIVLWTFVVLIADGFTGQACPG